MWQHVPFFSKDRSSHRRCFVRKGVFRNFAIFKGKHLYRSLFFNKVAGPRPATLLKKRLWHRCFPMNFAKFLRTPFLWSTSGVCFCKYSIINCRWDTFEEGRFYEESVKFPGPLWLYPVLLPAWVTASVVLGTYIQKYLHF